MKKQLLLWIQQLLSWYQTKRKLLVAVIGSILLVGFIVSFIGGYWFQWNWTGLTAQGNPKGASYQPEKTLWDWMQLLGVLAIPVVVAFGTIWLTAQQEKVSEAENTDNQRERALQDYIDKMSDLLLNKHLHESSEDEEDKKARQIARIRTLTVLRRLDAERKGNVIQFLQEAGLIKEEKALLDLARADLSNADLSGASLIRVNLIRANLREANLSGALLIGANLSNADLSNANLRETDFRRADLSKALLIGADLSNTDLSNANLDGAKITQEQLETAKSLQGATMPYGSKHP